MHVAGGITALSLSPGPRHKVMSISFPASFRAFAGAIGVAFVLALTGCGGGGAAPDEMTEFAAIMTEISSGDKQAGKERLDAFIEEHSNSMAYTARAKIRVEERDFAGAMADCEKGLELHPEDRELTWLLTELKKPEDQRFKGAKANSPRANK
jgi:hypothetical protein